MGLYTFLLTALEASALQPVGDWVASFEPERCQVERKFGVGEQQMTFAFRPSILGKGLEIMIQRPPGPLRSVFQRPAELRIMPADIRVKATYSAGQMKGDRGRAYFVYTDQTVARPTPLSQLFLKLGDDEVTIAPKGLAKAMAVLAQCRHLVAKHWGIDPAELSSVDREAEPLTPPETWIRPSDYPSLAVRDGLGGRTTVVWKILTDGSVADCRAVVSSGSIVLDQAACKAIVKRASYKPAYDKAGRRIISYDTAPVWWVPPS